MTTIEYWLVDGKLGGRPFDVQMDESGQRRFLTKSNVVKVRVSRSGTQITWCQYSSNWANLFYAMNWLHQLPAPYVLEFFNAGWFSEACAGADNAARRIEQLIYNSDVHLKTRTYLGATDIGPNAMTASLQDAWTLGSSPIEKSVICTVDPKLERSEVSYIGPRSSLATVWGMSPVSYPCQSGHSYDRCVSKPYFDVVRLDRPYRDHVLAAMMSPSGEVRWYGYQRVVFPGKANAAGKATVRIMTETAPVAIRIP
jgi:hypothetical protein